MFNEPITPAILTVSLLIKFNDLRKLTATLRITLTRWHKIGSLDISSFMKKTFQQVLQYYHSQLIKENLFDLITLFTISKKLTF